MTAEGKTLAQIPCSCYKRLSEPPSPKQNQRRRSTRRRYPSEVFIRRDYISRRGAAAQQRYHNLYGRDIVEITTSSLHLQLIQQPLRVLLTHRIHLFKPFLASIIRIRDWCFRCLGGCRWRIRREERYLGGGITGFDSEDVS